MPKFKNLTSEDGKTAYQGNGLSSSKSASHMLNVITTFRLWREIVDAVAKEFPDVVLEHILVDAAALGEPVAPARP